MCNMWTAYAFDNLDQRTAVDLKSAVCIQKDEFSILRHEADLMTNDYRYMSEWLLLPERIKKFDSACNTCNEYLDSKISIETLITQLINLEVDIRRELYNFLPHNLKKICDDN